MSAVRGRCPLMLRTGWLGGAADDPGRRRRSSSMARVVSDTCTVTVWCGDRGPRATFWPATMITPVFEARRCTRIGSVEGRGTGPAGRARCSRAASPGQRVGPGAQQLAGVGVEEQQRGAVLDVDPDPAAGEDLRGQHRLVLPSDTVPALGHGPLDLDDRAAGAAPGPPRTAAVAGRPGPRPGATRAARSLTLKCERSDLDPLPADRQVDPLAVDPEPHHLPGPGRTQPELRCRTATCSPTAAPPGRTRPAPPEPTPAPAHCAGSVSATGSAAGRAAAAATSRAGGSHSSSRSPARPGPGRTGPPGPPAPARPGPGAAGRRCSRSTHASTAACAASSESNGPGVVEEVGPEGAVEPLHLPVLVRRGRLRSAGG